MKTIIKFLCLVIFFTVSFSSLRADDGTPVFNVVKMEIIADGKIVGKPEFIMELGSTAVAEYAKPNGYSLKVVLNKADLNNSEVRVVDYELYLPERDRWVLSAKPITQTILNQNNRTIFQSKSGRNIEVKFSVEDNYKPISGVSYGNNKCTEARILAWKNDLSKPVSYSFKKAALQQSSTEKCCEVCRGYKCCSTGRVCCYDGYLCAGQGCCTQP